MPEQILRADARVDQQQKEKQQEHLQQQDDEKQKEKQVEYIKSLGKPADKAKAALRAAGLPIDHLLPEDVVAFEMRPDGTFLLKLARDVRIPIGSTTLVLTQQISGKLSPGKMTEIKGIYGEKKVAFITGKGNVTELRREGDDFLVKTDNSAASTIKLKVGDLKHVG